MSYRVARAVNGLFKLVSLVFVIIILISPSSLGDNWYTKLELKKMQFDEAGNKYIPVLSEKLTHGLYISKTITDGAKVYNMPIINIHIGEDSPQGLAVYRLPNRRWYIPLLEEGEEIDEKKVAGMIPALPAEDGLVILATVESNIECDWPTVMGFTPNLAKVNRPAGTHGYVTHVIDDGESGQYCIPLIITNPSGKTINGDIYDNIEYDVLEPLKYYQHGKSSLHQGGGQE